MQEAVSGATTEGERAPDGFGDGGANFLVLLMSVALGKAAVYEWANRHVGDDFGCWQEDVKGLG